MMRSVVSVLLLSWFFLACVRGNIANEVYKVIGEDHPRVECRLAGASEGIKCTLSDGRLLDAKTSEYLAYVMFGGATLVYESDQTFTQSGSIHCIDLARMYDGAIEALSEGRGETPSQTPSPKYGCIAGGNAEHAKDKTVMIDALVGEQFANAFKGRNPQKPFPLTFLESGLITSTASLVSLGNYRYQVKFNNASTSETSWGKFHTIVVIGEEANKVYDALDDALEFDWSLRDFGFKHVSIASPLKMKLFTTSSNEVSLVCMRRTDNKFTICNLGFLTL